MRPIEGKNTGGVRAEGMPWDDPAWIPGRAAARKVGISIPLLYEILKTGDIQTFLSKRHPHSKTGIRLVYWPSLERYMQERCEQANQEGHTVWVPVRAKGRSIKKEMPAVTGLRPKATGKIRFKKEIPTA